MRIPGARDRRRSPEPRWAADETILSSCLLGQFSREVLDNKTYELKLSLPSLGLSLEISNFSLGKTSGERNRCAQEVALIVRALRYCEKVKLRMSYKSI